MTPRVPYCRVCDLPVRRRSPFRHLCRSCWRVFAVVGGTVILSAIAAGVGVWNA